MGGWLAATPAMATNSHGHEQRLQVEGKPRQGEGLCNIACGSRVLHRGQPFIHGSDTSEANNSTTKGFRLGAYQDW